MVGIRAELTKQELIILHLSRYSNRVDVFDMPYSVTQDGIAGTLGISRAHASLELKKLEEKGLVDAILAHTPRSKNKRNTYHLTQTGLKKLADLEGFMIRNHIELSSVFIECPAVPMEKLRDPERARAFTEMRRAIENFEGGDKESTMIHLSNALRYVINSQEVKI